jgi:transcriptional regulator with XRE-family HTH domain
MRERGTRAAPSRSGRIAFGVTLRRQREKAGLSQEKLAFESGLDRTYISLLERGIRSPTLATIQRIASSLKLSAAEFVRLVEPLTEAQDDIPWLAQAVQGACGTRTELSTRAVGAFLGGWLQMKIRYYVIVVEGGVEPSLNGPFDTEERQSSVARRLHRRLAEDDSLFWADIDEAGGLSVGPYTAGFFLTRSSDTTN